MKILHLEDNATDAALTRELFAHEWPDCATTQVTSLNPFNPCTEALRNNNYELTLADFAVLGADGRSSLRVARDSVPDTPFVFLSVTTDDEQALDLLREASDNVFKYGLRRLLTVIPRVLRESDECRCKMMVSEAACPA